MKRTLCFLSLLASFHSASHGQTDVLSLPSLIVNEIGIVQGTDYQFLELMATYHQSATDPSGDYRGMTISTPTQVQESTFGVKLGTCFSTIPAGTLILIYDDATPHPGIDQSKDGYSASGNLLQLPISSPCLEFRSEQKRNIPSLASLLSLNDQAGTIIIQSNSGAVIQVSQWGISSNGNITVGNQPGNSAGLTNLCGNGGQSFSSSTLGSPGQSNNPQNASLQNRVAQNTGVGSFVIACDGEPGDSGANNGSISVLIASRSANASYTIVWNGPQSGSTNGALGANEISDLPSGTYTIVVSDDSGCSQSCETIVPTSCSTTICEGSCATIGDQNPQPPGYTYQWEPAAVFNDSTLPTQQVCPAEESTFTLTILDDSCNIVEVQECHVSFTRIDVIPNPAELCAPGELATLVPTQGFVTYNWFDESGTPIFSQSGGIVEIGTPGTYTVRATDASGCEVQTSVEVINAIDPYEIRDYLLNQGFICIPITVTDPIRPGRTNAIGRSNQLVEDCSVSKFIMENNPESAALLSDRIVEASTLCQVQGLSFVGRIADFTCACEGNFDLQNFANVQGYDVSLLSYVFDDPSSTDDCLLIRHHVEEPSVVDNIVNDPYNPDCDGDLNQTMNECCDAQCIEGACACAFGTVGLNPQTLTFNAYECDTIQDSWISLPDEVTEKDYCFFSSEDLVACTGDAEDLTLESAPNAIVWADAWIPTPSLIAQFANGLEWGTQHSSAARDYVTVLFNRFVEGSGTNLFSPCDSDIAEDLFRVKVTQNLIDEFEELLIDHYKEHKSFVGIEWQDFVAPPCYRRRACNGNSPLIRNKNTTLAASTYFGGTQCIEVFVTNVVQTSCYPTNGMIDVYFEGKIWFGDTFGLSKDDMKNQFMFPGLVAMWILQNYRNSECDSPPCFKPFRHTIEVYFKSRVFKVECEEMN